MKGLVSVWLSILQAFSIFRFSSESILALENWTMGKSYIVSAAQVDTLRYRKCWEKQRKIHGSGERTALENRNGGREPWHGGSQPRRRDVHTRQYTVYYSYGIVKVGETVYDRP